MEPNLNYPPPPMMAPEPERKRRGCLFSCGCALFVLFVLVVIASFAAYFGYSSVMSNLSSDQPVALPAPTLSPEAQQDLNGRLGAFQTALNNGAAPATLELSADELNTLLRTHPQAQPFGQWVYFNIENDQLKGQMSIPGDQTPLPGMGGRYFNGEAAFAVTVANGRLDVQLSNVTLNGQPVPDEALRSFESQFLQQINRDAELGKRLEQIESVEVQDGRLIITTTGSETPVDSPAEEAPVEVPNGAMPEAPAEPVPAEDPPAAAL